jgi:hypothetical protein
MFSEFCRVRPSHSFIVLSVLVSALLLASCNKHHRKVVYPVHGQVFDNKDKPAAGAMVVFHPVGGAPDDIDKPRAFVADDGSFALTTYEKDDGAPEGEYVVTIEWRPKSANPFDAKKMQPDHLKGRYSDVKRSRIRFKIEAKPDNKLEPIRLR